MFFAEFRRAGAEEWERFREEPFKTQERAKNECKKALLPWSPCLMSFRIVANDERGTIYYESHPPHGWRLRWVEPK